jgi:lactate dehydrogenase-like 2-hydroxyacid dehydrogenase
LRRLRGALLTPHVGSAQAAVRRQMADVVLDDLERFARGQRVRNRVTGAMLDRMT